MEQIGLAKIGEDVGFLRQAVIKIQEHLDDCFLTAEESLNIKIAEEEFENNQTTSLKDMKSDLGL